MMQPLGNNETSLNNNNNNNSIELNMLTKRFVGGSDTGASTSIAGSPTQQYQPFSAPVPSQNFSNQHSYSNYPQGQGQGGFGGYYNQNPGYGPPQPQQQGAFSGQQMQALMQMIKTKGPDAAKQAKSFTATLTDAAGQVRETLGSSPSTIVGTILSIGGSLSAKFGQIIHWPTIEQCPEPTWASLLLLIAFALIFAGLAFIVTVALGKDNKQLSASMSERSKNQRIWNAILCAVTIFSITLGFLLLNDNTHHCLPGYDVDPKKATVDWDLWGTILISGTIAIVVVLKILMVYHSGAGAYLIGIVSAAASVGANALLSSSTTIDADPTVALHHTVMGSQACMSFLTEETNSSAPTTKIQTNCLAFSAGTALISSYAGIFATTPNDDSQLIRNLASLSTVLFTHVGQMNIDTVPNPETLKNLITLALFPRAGEVLSVLARRKQLSKFEGIKPVVNFQLTFSTFMREISKIEPAVNKLVKECHVSSLSLGLEGMRFCDESIDDKLAAINNTVTSFLPTRVSQSSRPHNTTINAAESSDINNSWFSKLTSKTHPKSKTPLGTPDNQPLEASAGTSTAASSENDPSNTPASTSLTGDLPTPIDVEAGPLSNYAADDDVDEFGPLIETILPIFGLDTRSRLRIRSILEKTAAGQFIVDFLRPYDTALPDVNRLGRLFNVTNAKTFHNLAKKIRPLSSDSPLQTIVRRLVLHLVDDCYSLADAPSADVLYTKFYTLLLSELALRKISPIPISPDIHPSLYGLLCHLSDSTNPDIFELIETLSAKLGPVAAPLASIFFFEICDVHKTVPKTAFRNMILALAPQRTRGLLGQILGQHAPFRLPLGVIAQFFGIPFSPNVTDTPGTDLVAPLLSNILRMKMGSNSGRLFIRMLDRVISQRFSKTASFDGVLTKRQDFDVLFPTVDFDRLSQKLDSIKDVRLRNIVRNVSQGKYDTASSLLDISDLAGKKASPFHYLYSLFPHPLIKIILSAHPTDSNIVLNLDQFADFIKTLIPNQYDPVLDFYFFQKQISTLEIAKILNSHVDFPLFSEFLYQFHTSESIGSATKTTLNSIISASLRRLQNKARPALSNLSVFGLNSREITKLSRTLFGSLTPFRSLMKLLGDAVRWRLLELKPVAPSNDYSFRLDLGDPGEVIDWDDSFRSEFGIVGKKPSYQPLKFVRDWNANTLWFALSLTADHHIGSSSKIMHRMFSMKFDLFYKLFLDQVVTAITQLSKKLKRGILKFDTGSFKIPFPAFAAGIKAATDYVHALDENTHEDKLLQYLVNYTYGVSILSTQISLGKPSMNDDDLLKIGSATLTGIIRVYQTLQKNPFLETEDIIKTAFSGDMEYTIEPQNSFLVVGLGSKTADLIEDVENALHMN